MDWLERRAAPPTVGLGHQQYSFSGITLGAGSTSPGQSFVGRGGPALIGRLATEIRASDLLAGELCGSPALYRHLLSGRRVDRGGAHHGPFAQRSRLPAPGAPQGHLSQATGGGLSPKVGRMSAKGWNDLVGSLRRTLGGLPDDRRGDNTRYTMEDIGLSAFSVFFMQCPSFLSAQKTMEQAKGRSNLQSLFEVEQIPCDNHIRQTLDPVAPKELFGLYDEVLESLKQGGALTGWRSLGDTLLVALDGTWYFSSEKIHCPNCSCLEHKSGEKTYYHSAITPVIVAPGQPHAIPLRPEFITPQDGHTKQDCEIAAGKRWLEKNAARYAPLKATLLGDDLYAHQPFCRRTLLHDFHFLFVCKPDSHTTLYNYVNLLQRPQLGLVKARVKVGARFHTYTYRYANDVPLAEGNDALKVNWCELTGTDPEGKVAFLNGHPALEGRLLFVNVVI